MAPPTESPQADSASPVQLERAIALSRHVASAVPLLLKGSLILGLAVLWVLLSARVAR